MSDAVLIAGASGGIGRETAIHLAQRGFQVFATTRDLSRGDLDAEAKRRGAHLEVLPLEITDPASVRSAVHTVISRCGGIYGFVNCAGAQLRGYFEDLPDDAIRRDFEINVFGAMTLARAVLPHLRTARRGRIVLVTSVAGRIGSPASSSYCAAKFALEGFGESLAAEVAPLGVRVSLVEPGIVATSLWSANRGVAQPALDPRSAYYSWFRELERITDWAVRSSPARPEHVAAAVYRALASRNPRLRYPVGRRARALIGLRRLLPDAVFERFYFGTLLKRITTPKTAGTGGTVSGR